MFGKLYFLSTRRIEPWKNGHPIGNDLSKLIKFFSDNAYEIEELNYDNRILRINEKYLKRYNPILQEIKITRGK